MESSRLMQRLEAFVARSDGENRQLGLDVIGELDSRCLVLQRANEAMDEYADTVTKLIGENLRLKAAAKLVLPVPSLMDDTFIVRRAPE